MSYAESLILKFDLNKASIQSDPTLHRVYKDESALRVCLLIEVDGVFKTQDSALEGIDEDHVGFRIPSLEGSEIWIVPSSKKEKFEKALGFAKSSEVLIQLSFEKVRSFTLRDPLGRGDFTPSWNAVKSDNNDWGLHLAANAPSAWNENDTSALKDHGTFAFPSRMGEA